MGNKEHRRRLHGSTFWNAHLISNSKRLGIFLGANQVSALYLDQNLLPLNSHVNRNLGIQGTHQNGTNLRLRGVITFGFLRFVFHFQGEWGQA